MTLAQGIIFNIRLGENQISDAINYEGSTD